MSQFDLFDEQEALEAPIERPSDLVVDLKVNFSQIERLISQIRDLAKPSTEKSGVIFQIPLRDELDIPPFTPVTPLTGEEAWKVGWDTIQRNYRLEDQHLLVTLRSPGVLYIENLDEILPLIKQVNHHKSEFRRLMTLESNRYQRNILATQHFPGVVLLQAYRHIWVNQIPLRKLVFSWVKKTTGVKKLTKNEAIAMLKKEQKQYSAQQGFGSSNIDYMRIDSEIKFLEGLSSSEQLRLQRPVAPHPRVMGFNRDENLVNYEFSKPATTPILMRAEDCPKIRPLPDLDLSIPSKNRRKDADEVELLIPRHHLYLVKKSSKEKHYGF